MPPDTAGGLAVMAEHLDHHVRYLLTSLGIAAVSYLFLLWFLPQRVGDTDRMQAQSTYYEPYSAAFAIAWSVVTALLVVAVVGTTVVAVRAGPLSRCAGLAQRLDPRSEARRLFVSTLEGTRRYVENLEWIVIIMVTGLALDIVYVMYVVVPDVTYGTRTAARVTVWMETALMAAGSCFMVSRIDVGRILPHRDWFVSSDLCCARYREIGELNESGDDAEEIRDALLKVQGGVCRTSYVWWRFATFKTGWLLVASALSVLSQAQDDGFIAFGSQDHNTTSLTVPGSANASTIVSSAYSAAYLRAHVAPVFVNTSAVPHDDASFAVSMTPTCSLTFPAANVGAAWHDVRRLPAWSLGAKNALAFLGDGYDSECADFVWGVCLPGCCVAFQVTLFLFVFNRRKGRPGGDAHLPRDSGDAINTLVFLPYLMACGFLYYKIHRAVSDLDDWSDRWATSECTALSTHPFRRGGGDDAYRDVLMDILWPYTKGISDEAWYNALFWSPSCSDVNAHANPLCDILHHNRVALFVLVVWLGCVGYWNRNPFSEDDRTYLRTVCAWCHSLCGKDAAKVGDDGGGRYSAVSQSDTPDLLHPTTQPAPPSPKAPDQGNRAQRRPAFIY